MTTINIQPTSIRDDDKQTYLLTHLPEQIGKLHDVSYYEKQKRSVKLEKYELKQMPLSKPNIDEIEDEIRSMGKRYDGKQTADQILTERLAVWQELQAFHDRVEAEREVAENRHFQENYNAAIADIDDVISGQDNTVDNALHTAIGQLNLPFELTVKVSYNKAESRASVSANLPISCCIPTTKTVFHTRGMSIKNKLQREMQQEESECIIGLAILLAGQTFSVTPNIKRVSVALYQHTGLNGLLSMYFERDKFVQNQKTFGTPSVALYSWPYVANVRTVRDAMVLDPIEKALFQAQSTMLHSPSI